MKKIIKLLSFFSLTILIALLFNIKSYASENDASNRKYNIDLKWEYVSDIAFDEKKVNGSKYYEGSLWSWMGAYKYYDSKNDEMYVLLLSTIEMQSNQASYWDQHRWNNQKMSVTFYSNSSNVTAVNYSPEATTGEVSISNSLTIAGEVGSGGTKLGYAVGETITYTTNQISVTVSKSGNNKVSIFHNFDETYKKNKKLDTIYCSHVTRNNLILYKIKNYNSNKNTNFSIENEATFYRYGVFNQSSVSDKITQTFTI